MSIQVSASLLSANFLHLADDIAKSEAAGVDSFHLDVMDGHLAPNLSYGPPVIKAIRSATQLPLDAHLMIDQPWLFLDDYISLGVNSLLIHAESYCHESVDPQVIKSIPRKTTSINAEALKRDLAYIQSHGIQAGVTINPGTPLLAIQGVLKQCDSVLIMSVNPGFSGQSFILNVLPKIKELRSMYDRDIKVDGGVNDQTAPAVTEAGANVLITASYLYGSSDYAGVVNQLKQTPSGAQV